MTEAFYVPEGDGRFMPTAHTIGPWDARAQHGGPPAALLGRALERLDGGEGKRVARVTFELLRPVPADRLLSLDARVIRGGRRVDLCEAELSADGESVMTATAWRFRTASLELPAPERDVVAPPETGEVLEAFASPAQHTEDYYLKAMDIRFIKGSFYEPGDATAWFRARVPLVDGEGDSALTVILVAADSASGISARLDPGEWLFINTDLTVTLTRYPRGRWACLDATSLLEPSGIGSATALLRDEDGVIGRSAQSLLIDRR